MKLDSFTKKIVNELNTSPFGKRYLFKDQGDGEIWVGKWGKILGIKYTEFYIKITRNKNITEA